MDNKPGEMDSYNTAVATILRRLYGESGKSYQELADATGIARATIVRVINNERAATARYIHALAKEFGTTPGAIFNEADSI